MEIDLSIFLLQDRSQRMLGVILRHSRNHSTFQARQCFDQQLRAEFRQSRRQRLRSIGILDRHLGLQQHVACIETSVDLHRCHAGHAIARSNRPLDRRRAAIQRQQRRMNVDVPQRRQIDHPLRNNPPITNHNDRLRRNLTERLAKLLIVLDLLRLRHWQLQRQRRFLHR